MLLSERDKADIKRRLKKEMKGNVTISLFTTTPSVLAIPGRECPTCPETQKLLQDLAGLSPKLDLKQYDFFSETEERDRYGVERVPAIVLEAQAGSLLRYYGIPAGYEFAMFLEGINSISRGVSPLALDTRKKLRKVNHPVHIQVFVTPS